MQTHSSLLLPQAGSAPRPPSRKTSSRRSQPN
ncbi:MAG: hypothetical protein IH606_15050 [Burkholderiales bacterium]|nr:hypothetical protein [Burkholderiales bacterium]